MNMLYDSESFVVVHMFTDHREGMREMTEDDMQQRPNVAEVMSGIRSDGSLADFGFEIVDKRSGKEVFLQGAWAALFHQQVRQWQQNHPSEEEIEETLDQYTQLAQYPVLLH